MPELHNFPDSVLVGGCQRSGTTMLSEIIMKSDDIGSLPGIDKELSAALALVGHISIPNTHRYCFQTTYVNDCYPEYWTSGTSNKLVWMVRNPLSVVYSLTRFSERFCLDGLFMSCGRFYMSEEDEHRFNKYGSWTISSVKKACYCYNAKINQIFSIVEKMGRDKVLIIDYDELILDKDGILSVIFDFIDVSYTPEFSHFVHNKSLNKACKLSDKKRDLINSSCEQHYNSIRQLMLAV